MRQAIGKGLKSRSQAIRTAVQKYNALAEALNPPAPTVDFATLMEWTELQEFELLRHSRSGDVREKPWANPTNRLMAVKYYKLARAREELLRCRVETRRLVTAMHDEEQHFETVYTRLQESNPLLAREVRVHAARRMGVNTVHRDRLARLAVHAGFGDCLVPGTRIGAQAVERSNDVVISLPQAEGVQEGVQDDLDALDALEEEELGRLHDFLAELD